MPWLTTEGAAHQIADGETIVGSGPNAGWRLSSHDLAARHFTIELRSGRVTVKPCGVDDVIVINGVQSASQPVELHDGDTIDAADARFVFSSARTGSKQNIVIGPAHLVETRAGVVHAIETGSVGLGRDRINAVVIRDPTASRFHAEIRREAGGHVLHPHGSSGTVVNGLLATSAARLADGDTIQIASVTFTFRLGPLPEGSLRAEPAADDGSSHRPTVMQAAVMEIPAEEGPRLAPFMWIAAAIVIAATAYLAVR